MIPVHPVLKAELDAWKRKATSTRILTQANGRPWLGSSLSNAMATALQWAELPARLNVHGLRKLAASRLAEAGCSMHEIAITGHLSLSMVQLYAHRQTRNVSRKRLW